uniref:KIAA1045 RING finger domain-containing protein n=1 Tax=Arion vulgaris TaxID=1028688 RepID=A0A0B7AQM3_9EUPU
MGTNSSKPRKSKYDISHKVGDETVTTNVNNNSKTTSKNSIKKKTNKGSFKIKPGASMKKKSLNGNDPRVVNPNENISDNPEGTPLKKIQSNLVYRKKSSCPSCDGKDIILGKNRSRSGSDRSLRFSDFNKVLRKTRIYEWEKEPLDIPLYGAEKPKVDDICFICEVYTGSHIRACRVCCRAYHDSCLTKIGHPLLENSRRLIAANKWSCHQCVALNHLLTQEEVRNAHEDLENLCISEDKITEADYIKCCRLACQRQNKIFNAEREQNSIQKFRSEATENSGTITFTQYLNIESIRVLSGRCKDSLVHLLTKAEIEEARNIFQKMDNTKADFVTRSHVDSLFRSRSNTNYSDDSIMYMDENVDSHVTWADFLRDTAIFFLSQRPNIDDVQCPARNDVTDDGTLTFSSCDSLDVDDEKYITCNSKLDAESSVRKRGMSNTATNLPTSTEDTVSISDRSTTMLDEIDSAIDRERCKHEIEDRQTTSGIRFSQQISQEKCAEECTTTFSQTPAELNISQRDSINLSPKSASSLTGGHWAARSCKLPSERARSSPYNDSRHAPIPWEDVETSPGRKVSNDGKTKPGYRRSEVILRQATTTSDNTRAVSHLECKRGQNMVTPRHENLVGRSSNAD